MGEGRGEGALAVGPALRLPFDLEAKFESRHLDCYETVWENL